MPVRSGLNGGSGLDAVKKRAAAKAGGGYRGVEKTLSPSPGSTSSKLAVCILTAGVASVLTLVYVLWDQGVVQLPLLKNRYIERQLERYATIGPMLTTVGEDEHIKLTVAIECKDSSVKRRLSDEASAVKNSILMVLGTARAREYLGRKDYAALRPYLVEEIRRRFPHQAVKDIYFSEILRY